ncbi:hypothetical protein SteCoe_29244 [Stentor coeruleus]|uniref:Fucolectin tachylectin-4 pentraxin-1 domain-containing protein n=1 Tax=Stentor coeruleus TaxID=5963 RepID=A0A1R2B6F7_9CILI|nr:hypothetical protein SteCoe_29244 [Stentor coeruleus]
MSYILIILSLLAQISYSCISENVIDFKFYITSGTSDWVVSSQYPNGVYASVVSGPTSILPETSWIWENPVIFMRSITITRYFFVAGKPKSAILISKIDDTGSAKLNGGTSCSIPGFGVFYTCDLTSSCIVGLNKLEIIGTDTGAGLVGVMYKLTVISKLV